MKTSYYHVSSAVADMCVVVVWSAVVSPGVAGPVWSPDKPLDNPITVKTYGSCSSSQAVLIRDCSDRGDHSDGIYTLRPANSPPFLAPCQFDAEGQWTVIQRRVNGSVDFHRSWIEYKNGFGLLDSSFWLGNDHIHTLTIHRQMTLRVQLTDWEGQTKWTEYKFFQVDAEDNQYSVHYEDPAGTAGDGLGSFHKDLKFSTFDKDNDLNAGNCARQHGGGWWFNSCDHCNLNGPYNSLPTLEGLPDRGVEWDAWKQTYSFKETVMKIKPTFQN